MTADTRRWSVLIPVKVAPTVVEFPDTDVLRHAAPAIGCEWIEFVRARGLAVLGYQLAVDESGFLTGRDSNPFASWLYGADLHRQRLHGSALVMTEVITDEGPDLAWLTEAEARDLLARLTTLRIPL